MAIVTEYSWETNSWAHHGQPPVETDDLASHQRWVDAVSCAGEKARQAMPTHAERITRALALVIDGHVTRLPDGTFQVKSQSKSQSKGYHVAGWCECPDARRSSDGVCKHLLATFLYRRAKRMLQEPVATSTSTDSEPTAVDSAPTSEPVETSPSVPPQHVVMIQGKPFVKFAGLLQMAHERGLVALTADWTYNDAELSLAHAVAIFADGRRFEESGDASPANTNRKVAVHFRRVALTRAKARVLRDALGIDLVAVEELSDSD